MSGLRKAKKYDWKDSNLALFGSDTEKQVKKESAETEPAWHGAGQSVGLQIWRINKFKVEAWPKEDYGNFYTGDSYIILNTYKDKESDELLYDVHFWIGKYSTQDEYGTAAYKTVELDTLLDDKPVQHRECQDHESPLFRSYFKNLTLMEGGADTGFRHVLPEQYIPRLMHCKKVGPRSFEVKEVKRSKASLRDEDVFILDTGLICYLWNGKECSRDESFKAAQYLQTLISQRNGKPTKEVLDAGDISDSHPFYEYLNDDNDDDDDDDEQEEETAVKLLRVSDADGSLDLEPVKEGSITKDDLDSNDVMIIDSGKNCSVWIGSGASIDEKRNAMAYADKYLKTTNHCVIPITIMVEGSRATIPGVA